MATIKSDDDGLEQWYLDTRYSNHMTGHKGWFVSIDEKVKRKIRFADNSTMTAKGVNNVLIQRRDDKQSFICDALYVPNMKNNMLSLRLLLEKGYSMKIEHGEMRMFNNSRRLILKAPLSKNRTFKIDIQISENKCLVAEIRNEDWSWH
ncbi:uncharacterized protein [Cicer arietinum]|uniref:Uncharacterized protein LOC101496439 n=1 Tax=Cicer arietinum TaxID=3827 RepID=A0A1S2Y6P5_CICAR|nr:uncharacterized protein LOC101496439 [Cicer arietinum]